jgi:futalosine hydrolase
MSIVVLAATRIEAAGLEGTPGDVVVSGIGSVNAAHALTRRLLADPAVTLVIQTGIAGAYVGAALPVGAVALATEEIYGDLGVITPKGWEPTSAFGIPLVEATAGRPQRFNHFPLDATLVREAASVCGALVSRTGPFLTLSQVTGLRTLGDALFARFGAICESMEGAAAAHVCALHDIPFLEVRGISNLVEDRNRASWRVSAAVESANAVTRRLAEHGDRLLASSAVRTAP